MGWPDLGIKGMFLIVNAGMHVLGRSQTLPPRMLRVLKDGKSLMRIGNERIEMLAIVQNEV